ncbi:fimbrillin family protein [Parabacteroides sp.]
MRDLVLFTSMTLCFWGCSGDKDLGGLENIGWHDKPLQIATRVLTTKSVNFIQEFNDRSILGLQITSGVIDNLYNDVSAYKNVSAEARMVDGRIRWQQSPEVILNSEEAKIYAYYPYQEDINFNPRQIPVRLAPNALETDDYMYGTHAIGQKAVNSASPLVLLSMNHALSLLSFQLNLSEGKTGAFIVSSVQVGNKPGGTALVREGTLDITTGDIIGSTACSTCAATVLSLANPVTMVNDIYCDPMRLMVIPTSGRIGTGDVEALFTINGETYKFEIPADTQWEKGKKYLYKLSFNGRSLQLRDVSITDWLPGNDEGLVGNIM